MNGLPYKRHWEQIDTKGEIYSPRTGHTLALYKEYIYVFGGTDSEKRQNDLHKLCVETGVWTKVDVASKRCRNDVCPSRRSGAKGAVYKDKFFIFGGYDGRGGNYFNDIYAFDFIKEKWEYIRPKEITNLPAPRTDHSLIFHEDKLIIFGGYDGSHRLDDIYSFDLNKYIWKEHCIKSNKEPGIKPCSRFAHSAVCHKNKMYIFGGWNGRLTLNSLWVFDFHLEVWTPLYLGNEPKPNSKLYREIQPEEEIDINWPQHRYRHTAVVHQDCMYIFGGVDKSHERFNDVQSYNFITHKWSRVDLIGVLPASRTFHPALVLRGYMYIFGGYDGDIRLNDIFRLFLGKLDLPSLQTLAGNAVRNYIKNLKINLNEIPEILKNGFFWNRDLHGDLRGRLLETVDKEKVVFCDVFVRDKKLFNSSGKDICFNCGSLATKHEKIPEVSKKRLTNSMVCVRNIFKKNLNFVTDDRKNSRKSNSRKKRMSLRLKSSPRASLAVLTQNDLNNSLRINVKIEKSGCSSPTLNEPEATKSKRARGNLTRTKQKLRRSTRKR